MVHRDVKPANLLVTRPVGNDSGADSGVSPRPSSALLRRPGTGLVERPGANPAAYPWGLVKILDLGLARWEGEASQLSTMLTQLGSLMGTPDFIAPEQARDSHTSDIRADIYSLGC